MSTRRKHGYKADRGHSPQNLQNKMKDFKLHQRIITKAYNAGWDGEGSEDAPAWCEQEWELWARHWKAGRADNVEELNGKNDYN